MNIILYLALGALAGWAARLIMGSPRAHILWDILIGVIGAALGGLIASALGLGSITRFNLYSVVVAIFGACLLLALASWLKRYIR